MSNGRSSFSWCRSATGPTQAALNPRSQRLGGVCWLQRSNWNANEAHSVSHHDPQTRSPSRRRKPYQNNCLKEGRKSHHHKTEQTRRCTSSSKRYMNLRPSMIVLLCGVLVFSLLCEGASAAGTPSDRHRSARHQGHAKSELLYDRSEPPIPPRMKLFARQDDESSTAIFQLSSTSNAAASTAVSTGAVTTSTSLPQPFDQSLGSNFTSQSCPNFFQSFLKDPTFQACTPFSLLLQNSKAFFDASKSLVRITQVLDASCSVNTPKCVSLMSSLAIKIRLDANCGADFDTENPLVRQAYNGLVTYKLQYEAGCIKSSSGSYCFANAITNVTAPSDAYVYYLPLGVGLPGGARPTCNQCLKETMGVYASGAANASLPVSRTYGDAASSINILCGPTFVNGSVAVTSGAITSRLQGNGITGLVMLLVVLCNMLL